MEINYIYILIGAVTFMVGLVFGIQTVKFFSDELIHKLENSLSEQLKINEQLSQKSIEQLVAKINQKVDFIEQINGALKSTFDYLKINTTKVESLNKECDTRKELEFEIIKLKKIIQRLEKKR